MDRKSPYLCTVLKRQLIVLLKNLKDTMKKLVFMFVAFAAISFASCGNKTSDAAATSDSDSVSVDSAADTTSTDTTAADSAATTADTTAAEPNA